MQFNAEQIRIIKSKPNGHRLIKGAVGTGKTTVATNKIPGLLKHYCIDKTDRVLMVTYNEQALNYLSYIYDNIEQDKYVQSSFFDEDNSHKLEIKTIDSLILCYFNDYKKSHNLKLEIASNIECESILIDAIKIVGKKYKKLKFLNNEYFNFIQEEINWIKSCNYTNCEEYQIAGRSGRTNNIRNDKVIKLRKHSKQREAIYEVFKEYNNRLSESNIVDSQDVILLALYEANKKNCKKYTHILIDDSQALTKIQLQFLKAIYHPKMYSSITFIMDTDENKYPKGYLTRKKAFMSLGFNMKGKSNSLKKMYNKCDLFNTNTCSTIKKENEINDYKKEQDDLKKSYSLDTTKYIDLKRNVSYEFIRDSSSNNEIYIEEDGQEKKIEDLSYIPVYNEIAAGNPILINDLLADNYLLPKSWIRGSSNIFMLKIKGDSMINKNINDGDYVLINKQNFASIGDIVAVDIEGEATLKTYKIKDNKISLMPENDKYEPIILDENEFNIIGVAVGLIKN